MEVGEGDYIYRWGMEVGGRGRLYTYHYTIAARMTLALRWAEMTVILTFH